MSEVNTDTLGGDQNQIFEFEPGIQNPHTLWKQLALVVLFTTLFAFFNSPMSWVIGAFTFLDAWNAGIYKDKNKKDFLNISPAAWAIAMAGLLIITLPLYIINRNKIKTKKGNMLWFVLTIISGAIPLVLTVITLLSK